MNIRILGAGLKGPLLEAWMLWLTKRKLLAFSCNPLKKAASGQSRLRMWGSNHAAEGFCKALHQYPCSKTSLLRNCKGSPFQTYQNQYLLLYHSTVPELTLKHDAGFTVAQNYTNMQISQRPGCASFSVRICPIWSCYLFRCQEGHTVTVMQDSMNVGPHQPVYRHPDCS